MIGFLKSILKVKTFEELRLPLAVTATDLSTGEGVVFHSGPLVEPVRASCAYPGMFLPVNIRGRWLVDGMLAYAVPTKPLVEMGASRVLAVHLKGRWTNGSAPRHLFDVIGQCFAIAQDMAIRVVSDTEQAIAHINRYSTKHSEAIVTSNEANARRFLQAVDSAAVYWNASTRFTDGAEFGFGAEMGISTQKLHCRGPFALGELTSSKYEVVGCGQVRP